MRVCIFHFKALTVLKSAGQVFVKINQWTPADKWTFNHLHDYKSHITTKKRLNNDKNFMTYIDMSQMYNENMIDSWHIFICPEFMTYSWLIT